MKMTLPWPWGSSRRPPLAQTKSGDAYTGITVDRAVNTSESRKAKHMTITTPIGNNIQYFRSVRGVSLEELSNRCGLRQDHISKIERGECMLAVDEFFQIAQALDCQPTELLLWPKRWPDL